MHDRTITNESDNQLIDKILRNELDNYPKERTSRKERPGMNQTTTLRVELVVITVSGNLLLKRISFYSLFSVCIFRSNSKSCFLP